MRYSNTFMDDTLDHRPTPPIRESSQARFPAGIVIKDETFTTLRRIADIDCPVLTIYGETGTGKEEIAKLYHGFKDKKINQDTPFIAVNCANLLGDLALSQLFGHKKGAFTGASVSNVGLVGKANNGILFLDEIHHLSHEVQRQLLRVLNDGKYTPIGSQVELTSNFDVVLASTQNLDDCVENGNFLLDLRMRLTGIDINLKPLRERFDEIEDFVDFFLLKNPQFSVSCDNYRKLVEECQNFYWQGNIRQLFKVLYQTCINAYVKGEDISVQHMPLYKTMLTPKYEQESLSCFESGLGEFVQLLHEYEKEPKNYKKVMEALEKYLIQRALELHPKLMNVFDNLGISRSTLDNKRKKYGLV